MKRQRTKKQLRACAAGALAAASLLAAALAAASGGQWLAAAGSGGPASASAGPALSAAGRQPPPLPTAPALADDAALLSYGHPGGHFGLDHSTAAEGYILARCTADRAACIVLEKGAEKRQFCLPADGEAHVIPLTLGSGAYTVKLLLQKEGEVYTRVAALDIEADIGDPRARYLLPNPMAAFGEGSAVVQIARELYAATATEEAFIAACFGWIADNIRYDQALLGGGQSAWYLPDLERVVAEGSAICADYASLFAALLRSCGIPCQIVYGDIQTGTGTRYHAWNLVWIEAEGAWRLYDPTHNTFQGGRDDDWEDRNPAWTPPLYGAPQEIY